MINQTASPEARSGGDITMSANRAKEPARPTFAPPWPALLDLAHRHGVPAGRVEHGVLTVYEPTRA